MHQILGSIAQQSIMCICAFRYACDTDDLAVLMQIYQCVDHQYNIIDCATVCHVHNCQPHEERQQCGNSFFYKTVNVQAGGEHRCKNAVCEPKSGTCRPRGGHHHGKEMIIDPTLAS